MSNDELAEFLVAEFKRFVDERDARLRKEWDEKLATLPTPRDGTDGRDGKDGADGVSGKDGRDGVDGKDGTPGEKGLDGKDGADGKDGKDADIEPLRRELHAEVATMKAALAEAVKAIPTPQDGRDGRDGKDGKDGIGKHEIHDAVESALENRLPGLIAKASEAAVASVPPTMTYKDVWDAGADYGFANTVTYSGSLWHCNVTGTKARPGTNGDWTLVAKRGRDGKDAK